MILKRTYQMCILTLVLSLVWVGCDLYVNHCNITGYNNAIGSFALVFSRLQICPGKYSIKVNNIESNKDIILSISNLDANGTWQKDIEAPISSGTIIPISKSEPIWYSFNTLSEDDTFDLEVIKE